jgi:hypothetical protein
MTSPRLVGEGAYYAGKGGGIVAKALGNGPAAITQALKSGKVTPYMIAAMLANKQGQLQ